MFVVTHQPRKPLEVGGKTVLHFITGGFASIFSPILEGGLSFPAPSAYHVGNLSEFAMPITLGCPSCGKRFRAREESSGKKVKCPFCQAAVPVPTMEEAQNAGAPTDVVPAAPSGSAAGTMQFGTPAGSQPGIRPIAPNPLPAANAEAWGADVPRPIVLEEEPPFAPTPPLGRPSPIPPPPAPKPIRPPSTVLKPEQENAAAWKRARSGLGWVLFGLFWIALLGFIPIGKIVYERSVGPLPKGDGTNWIKIEGYINAPGAEHIELAKEDILELLLYGVPVLLGGLALSFGRLTAGAAPRNSGAKGLFAFGGLITFVALVGYGTYALSHKVGWGQMESYGLWAAKIGAVLGEFWFLLALAGCGATLRRPATVRAVGFFALLVGVAVAIHFVLWDVYVRNGAQIGRPNIVEPGSDWQFYEAAALLLGWLILVGSYWRAVRGVRQAIRDHVHA